MAGSARSTSEVFAEETGPASETAGPLLTVIVPAFNEVTTIEALLGRVLAAPYDKQVIVVDDGSTDATAAIVDKWAAQPNVDTGPIREPPRRRGQPRPWVTPTCDPRCPAPRTAQNQDSPRQFSERLTVHHAANRGKGRAIRAGLELARGRFTIIQDADLEYDPNDYPKLIEPLLAGTAQAVFGSRYLLQPEHAGPWLFRWGVALLNRAVRAIYGARLTDEATCYKVMSTDLWRSMDLQCERFEFCPEVTAKLCRLRIEIVEIPVSYHARDAQAGKKIRWRDGWAALRELWKWRRWEPRRVPAPHHGASATVAVIAESSRGSP